MGKLKGAIFDMDGTLVDSLMLWDVVWCSFGKKFLNGGRFEVRKEDDKAVRTMTLSEAMCYIHRSYNIGSSSEELLQTVNGILNSFYACDVMLKDGVLEFLEDCYDSGVKMCIASATDINLVKLCH